MFVMMDRLSSIHSCSTFMRRTTKAMVRSCLFGWFGTLWMVRTMHESWVILANVFLGLILSQVVFLAYMVVNKKTVNVAISAVLIIITVFYKML